jgi:uncharacterized protein (DUF924 family)
MAYQGGEAYVADEGLTTRSVAPSWVVQVLDFWFRELGDETFWFGASSDLDERIRRRFLAVHEQIIKSGGWGLAGARPLLAGIVVLDQFSRNMFRGTPRTFAADRFARRLAEQVIALRLDLAMTIAERYFVYLPFEHSEDREHQALAVRLIEQLGNESWTRYARAHQLLIERFGRFPHRNAVLGRTSSLDELQFLKEPMGSS